MTTKYQLLVKKGPMRGHIYPLNAILVTLGRDPLADIVISDPEVSRQHARLMETENGYELQDLGSTNGTFVDGQRLGGEVVVLQPGQQIEMGSGVMLLYQPVPTGDDDKPTLVGRQEEEKDAIETAVSPSGTPFTPDVEPLLPSWATELQQPQPEPVYAAPRVETASLGSEPTPPSSSPSATADGNKRRRTLLIGLATLFLLFGCCCAFSVFMWYIGGDWLLMQLGVLP